MKGSNHAVRAGQKNVRQSKERSWWAGFETLTIQRHVHLRQGGSRPTPTVAFADIIRRTQIAIRSSEILPVVIIVTSLERHHVITDENETFESQSFSIVRETEWRPILSITKEMTMSMSKIAWAFCAAFGVLSSVAYAGEAPPPPVVSICTGGAQEAVVGGTFNGSVNKAGASWALVPNTQFSAGPSGFAGDSDLYTVTFSAQANNSVAGTSWLVQAEVSVNGGAFQPIDPNGPNTFHSGNVVQTHTMTWCRRLEASVNAEFRIVWWKVGAGNAIADDYLMRVERTD
jgi:hypothetical protein